MTQEHTAEPWVLEDREDGAVGYILRGGDGDFINYLEKSRYFGNIHDSEQEANARRIVACVNALAGISTEAIEGGVIAELVEAARQLRNAFDGQVQRMTDRDLSESEHLLCKLFAQARDNLDRPLAKLEASK